MKNKVVLVKFSNGQTFEIPAEVIAENRTGYYASLYGFLRDSVKWNEEFKLSLSMDSYEMTDWAANNMDWKDVSRYAKLIAEKSIDYEKEWTNSEMKVEERSK